MENRHYNSSLSNSNKSIFNVVRVRMKSLEKSNENSLSEDICNRLFILAENCSKCMDSIMNKGDPNESNMNGDLFTLETKATKLYSARTKNTFRCFSITQFLHKIKQTPKDNTFF